MGDTESVDDRIRRVAERQFGLISRPQALHAGLSVRGLQRRIASGRLVVVDRAAYRVPGAPECWEQQMLGALLTAGPTAVASHQSAARLWGLPGRWGDVAEISTPPGSSYRGGPATAHRIRPIDPVDRACRRGIPVTGIELTLLHLAGTLGDADVVEDALEYSLYRRFTSTARLRWRLQHLARPGRDGSALMQELLALRNPGEMPAESVLESRAARLFRKAGLGKPTKQRWVRLPGGWARLDSEFDDGLTVELDGFRDHGKRAAFESDRERGNLVVLSGRLLLRFTWRDVLRREGYVISTLQRARELRGA